MQCVRTVLVAKVVAVSWSCGRTRGSDEFYGITGLQLENREPEEVEQFQEVVEVAHVGRILRLVIVFKGYPLNTIEANARWFI